MSTEFFDEETHNDDFTNGQRNTVKIHVLSYNLNLLPLGSNGFQRERIDTFLRNVDVYDVLLLQEVYASSVLPYMMQKVFCYQSLLLDSLYRKGFMYQVTGRQPSYPTMFRNSIATDSGLIIASRFPIRRRGSFTFRHCGQEQHSAPKGCLVAEIEVPTEDVPGENSGEARGGDVDRGSNHTRAGSSDKGSCTPVIVFNVHMRPEEGSVASLTQLQQLRVFVTTVLDQLCGGRRMCAGNDMCGGVFRESANIFSPVTETPTRTARAACPFVLAGDFNVEGIDPNTSLPTKRLTEFIHEIQKLGNMREVLYEELGRHPPTRPRNLFFPDISKLSYNNHVQHRQDYVFVSHDLNAHTSHLHKFVVGHNRPYTYLSDHFGISTTLSTCAATCLPQRSAMSVTRSMTKHAADTNGTRTYAPPTIASSTTTTSSSFSNNSDRTASAVGSTRSSASTGVLSGFERTGQATAEAAAATTTTTTAVVQPNNGIRDPRSSVSACHTQKEQQQEQERQLEGVLGSRQLQRYCYTATQSFDDMASPFVDLGVVLIVLLALAGHSITTATLMLCLWVLLRSLKCAPSATTLLGLHRRPVCPWLASNGSISQQEDVVHGARRVPFLSWLARLLFASSTAKPHGTNVRHAEASSSSALNAPPTLGCAPTSSSMNANGGGGVYASCVTAMSCLRAPLALLQDTTDDVLPSRCRSLLDRLSRRSPPSASRDSRHSMHAAAGDAVHRDTGSKTDCPSGGNKSSTNRTAVRRTRGRLHPSAVSLSRRTDEGLDLHLVDSLATMWRVSARRHRTRRCLGFCGDMHTAEWLSYNTVDQRARALGSGLTRMGVQSGQLLAVQSEACIAATILDVCCALYGFVTLPLTGSSNTIRALLDQHRVRVALADRRSLTALLTCRSTALETIVCLEAMPGDSMVDREDEDVATAKDLSIALVPFHHVEHVGRVPNVLSPAVTPDRCTVFTCTMNNVTSGGDCVTSTLIPVSHGDVLEDVCALQRSEVQPDGCGRNDVMVWTAPYALLFHRLFVLGLLGQGNAIAAAAGSGGRNTTAVSLPAALALFHPTLLLTSPAQFVASSVQLRRARKRHWALYNWIMDRLFTLRSHLIHVHNTDSELIRTLFFRHFRRHLGGAVRLIVLCVSQESTPFALMEHISVCYHPCVREVSYQNRVGVCTVDGVPVPGVHVHLHHLDALAQSQNIGQLAVSGRRGGQPVEALLDVAACWIRQVSSSSSRQASSITAASGNESAASAIACSRSSSSTKGNSTDDGNLLLGRRTLRLLGPTLGVLWPDAHQFVLAGELEMAYMQSRYVSDVFLYCAPCMPLIAVVYPNRDTVEYEWRQSKLAGPTGGVSSALLLPSLASPTSALLASPSFSPLSSSSSSTSSSFAQTEAKGAGVNGINSNGLNGSSALPPFSWDELVQFGRPLILADLQAIGAEEQLPASHIPHYIHLHPHPFRMHGSFVTPFGKLCREHVRNYFTAAFDRLYNSEEGSVVALPYEPTESLSAILVQTVIDDKDDNHRIKEHDGEDALDLSYTRPPVQPATQKEEEPSLPIFSQQQQSPCYRHITAASTAARDMNMDGNIMISSHDPRSRFAGGSDLMNDTPVLSPGSAPSWPAASVAQCTPLMRHVGVTSLQCLPTATPRLPPAHLSAQLSRAAAQTIRLQVPFAVDIGGTFAKFAYIMPPGTYHLAQSSVLQLDDSPLSRTLGLRSFSFFADRAAAERELKEFPRSRVGMLRFGKIPTDQIPRFATYLGEIDVLRRFRPDCAQTIRATGGGAFKYAALARHTLGVSFDVMREIDAVVKGLNLIIQLVPESIFTVEPVTGQHLPHHLHNASGDADKVFPYLLINIGSGISFIKCTAADGTHERVGGSPIGGATFWGLTQSLTNLTSWDEVTEIMRLDGPGDNKNVDLLVGDIYGYNAKDLPAMLMPDTVASSFGKFGTARFDSTLAGSQTHQFADDGMAEIAPPLPSGEFESPTTQAGSSWGKNRQASSIDIVRSLLNMIAGNVTQLAYLHARINGVQNIFFAGGFVRNNDIILSLISSTLQYWSSGKCHAHFVEHDVFLSTLGCAVADVASATSGPTPATTTTSPR